MIRQLWFASLWIAIVVFLGARVDAAEIGWDGAYEGNPINSDCDCTSACALIWLGSVHRTGAVGLHRPRIEDQAFKTLPPDAASKLYRTLLASVVMYLKEMDTPERSIQTMATTGSTEMIWVEDDFELERPASIAEWIGANCSHCLRTNAGSRKNLRTNGMHLRKLKPGFRRLS